MVLAEETKDHFIPPPQKNPKKRLPLVALQTPRHLSGRCYRGSEWASETPPGNNSQNRPLTPTGCKCSGETRSALPCALSDCSVTLGSQERRRLKLLKQLGRDLAPVVGSVKPQKSEIHSRPEGSKYVFSLLLSTRN